MTTNDPLGRVTYTVFLYADIWRFLVLLGFPLRQWRKQFQKNFFTEMTNQYYHVCAVLLFLDDDEKLETTR
jgi:hypothetical protein